MSTPTRLHKEAYVPVRGVSRCVCPSPLCRPVRMSQPAVSAGGPLVSAGPVRGVGRRGGPLVSAGGPLVSAAGPLVSAVSALTRSVITCQMMAAMTPENAG